MMKRNNFLGMEWSVKLILFSDNLKNLRAIYRPIKQCLEQTMSNNVYANGHEAEGLHQYDGSFIKEGGDVCPL